MTRDNLWSAEELFSFINHVHSVDVEYRGKTIRVNYKELDARETPDITELVKKLDKNLSDEARQAKTYQIMMQEKSWAMIDKAQQESPEQCDIIWTRENFDMWPDIIKGAVCMELCDLSNKLAQHFSNGDEIPPKQ